MDFDIKISVVIPTLISSKEQLEMTSLCLSSKQKTCIDHETIIVETESDHLIDYADIYIHEKKRTTCTKSINRGFLCASGDYVVLLTNDVILSENWLECLVDCFKKRKDCGLATLATKQLHHCKENKIDEGIWFSVAMMPSNKAWFDENYVNSWDDTDLVMQTYIDGFKMYRNYNCVVDHYVGATEYLKKDHHKNYVKNEKYFKKKYKDYQNHPMYKTLTTGVVV